MKAMLLAAGRGERLRPLTNTTPKPMLIAGGQTLIEHQLARLKNAGITDVVVNLHHLGDQIRTKLRDGAGMGMSIAYSVEPDLLETGGGILHALPLLGRSPFVVVSADTYIDFDLGRLTGTLLGDCLGCLVMTRNPPHHEDGDFSINADGLLANSTGKLTYTGTGLLAPALVGNEKLRAFKLREVFDEAIHAGKLQGIFHDGYWCDVGTVERLEDLRKYLAE